MKLELEDKGIVYTHLSLKEKLFGVKPKKMKELISSNPKILEYCGNLCDFVLFFVRPWECPGGTGPALIAYGKCVPKTFKREYIKKREKKGKFFGMYEADMLREYYGINKDTKNI